MATEGELGGVRVLVAGVDDGPVDARRGKDLMAEAHAADAAWLVLDTADLDPAFFDLRSGVAGDLLQAGVVYGMRLAIVGPRPEPAASSRAFAALVRESNRGRDVRFAETMEALGASLAQVPA